MSLILFGDAHPSKSTVLLSLLITGFMHRHFTRSSLYALRYSKLVLCSIRTPGECGQTSSGCWHCMSTPRGG